MFRSVLPIRVTVPAILALCLTACGGGGGDTPAPPAQSLAKLSSAEVPTQWPENFKTVSVSRTDLVSNDELTQTTNEDTEIHIQVWYLNQDQQRQPVAILTLKALGTNGILQLKDIPIHVNTLYSEVYTANNGVQLTLANRGIAI